MSTETQRAWAAGGLSAGGLAWLYGGDLAEHARARAAEVYAAPALPDAVFAGGVLVALAVCLGIAAFGLRRGRPASWKGFRLLPILAVMALFLDLFVLHGEAQRLPSDVRLAGLLEAFAGEATQASSPQAVLADPAALEKVARGLGAPGYLVRGVPVEAFRVEVKEGCEGPSAPAPGTAAGTLVYCVAKDRTQAWVTASALPVERRSGGEPAAFTSGGTLIFAQATARPLPPRTNPETGRPLVPDAGSEGAARKMD